MPIKRERQYRSLSPLAVRTDTKRLETEFYVEGYAATWEPYPLYEDVDGTVYEKFEPDAISGCDLSDVIMQYDHAGRVLARASNGTLLVEPDEHGLFIAADLGKSENAKGMYEEIASGLVTAMSWAFMPDEYYFDAATRTLVHTHVKKIYDVSAVSIPANAQSEIHARSFVGGELDRQRREAAAREKIQARLRLKLKLGGF